MRRISYAGNLARYYGATGESEYPDPENLCAVNEEPSDDKVLLISQDVIKEMREAPGTLGLGSKEDRARLMRSSDLLERGVPCAMVDPAVADASLVLLPGQGAVVPAEWNAAPGTTVTKCNPDAPAGLVVYPGTFDYAQ